MICQERQLPSVDLLGPLPITWAGRQVSRIEGNVLKDLLAMPIARDCAKFTG